jgi:predicted enzyme related to lactoylglutathione lyase
MVSGLKTIIYPVKNLESAKALYGELFGAAPYIDQPYYAAFNAGGQDVGLDPNGHAKGMAGPIPYWHVENIHARLQTLVDAGAVMQQEPTDVGGGNLTATVADADGNVTGLIQEA